MGGDQQISAQSASRQELFKKERQRLFGLAYRFLGSRAEAEDVLQDAFLRLEQADFESIRRPEGWLTTVVAHLALDRLRSAQAQRETYPGVWLPEPIVESPSPEEAQIEQSDLSIAFLYLLECLGPEERAVFVLREALDYPYKNISAMLGKSEASCRQMVSRAKTRLQRDAPRRTDGRRALSGLTARYIDALTAGDEQALLSLLTHDAVYLSDGGGKVTAALNPIYGSDRILRFIRGLKLKYGGRFSFEPATVNGEPGLLIFMDGRPDSVCAFDSDGERIRSIYQVRNPDKLTSLSGADFNGSSGRPV